MKAAAMVDASVNVSDEAASRVGSTPKRGRDQQVLAAWLEKTAQHDGAAFKMLYEATAPRLFAVALRIVRSSSLAEEVLQDSFVKVWTHAPSYRSRQSSPMTWLVAIVRNSAFDALRGSERKPLPVDWEVQDASAKTLKTRHQAALEAALLQRLFAQLEPMQRRAIGLAFYQGLAYIEVALAMRIPLEAAKTWIRRGLATLQPCLEAGSTAGSPSDRVNKSEDANMYRFVSNNRAELIARRGRRV